MPTPAEMDREIVQRVKNELSPMAFPMPPDLQEGDAPLLPETDMFHVGFVCGAFMLIMCLDTHLDVILINMEVLPSGMIVPGRAQADGTVMHVHGLQDEITNEPLTMSGLLKVNTATGKYVVEFTIIDCFEAFQLIKLLARVESQAIGGGGDGASADNAIVVLDD